MTPKEAIKKIQARIDTDFLNDEPFPTELEIAIEALEKQAIIAETSDKYRWHNLRKDPTDLPTHENDVLILESDYDGEWEKYRVTTYARVWNPFTNKRMEDLKRWGLPQYHTQDNVIAWREIDYYDTRRSY